jgi:ribosomal protein L28
MHTPHLETKGQRRRHKPNLLKHNSLFSNLKQVIQMTSSTMLEMEDKKYQISQEIATVSTQA